MYIVISYDINSTTDIKLHAVTSNLQSAQNMFDFLVNKYAKLENPISDIPIFELFHTPEDFIDFNGHCWRV